MDEPRRLILTEHKTERYPRSSLSEAQGELILRHFGAQIDIDFPTPRSSHMWELTAKGWVGILAIDQELTLVSVPKVEVGNLARMLAIAYDVEVEDFAGLASCKTLPDLYDQLASMLARHVQRIARQSFHHAYQSRHAYLAAVRGRMDLTDPIAVQTRARTPCTFSERTADVPLNRIPLWTIDRVLRSGLCSDPVQHRLRESHRLLSRVATLTEANARDCSKVVFDRLTDRYRPVIALSRLLLETAGPVGGIGEAVAPSFLVHMPSLFEKFVALWLKRQFEMDGSRYSVETQERHEVGDRDSIQFFIDLVISDRATGRAVCVLDTKYKDARVPSAQDVAQIGYYASLKRTRLGGLVFPASDGPEWSGMSGSVSTFRSTFSLQGPLSTAGEAFYQGLLARLQGLGDLSSAVHY